MTKLYHQNKLVSTHATLVVTLAFEAKKIKK